MILLFFVGLGFQLLCFSMLAACLRLAWYGGTREQQMTAAMFVAAAIATIAANRHHYAEPELAMMLVDAALFIGLASLAVRSAHFWPLWAAGFQLVSVLVHLAMFGQKGAGNPDAAWAYAIGLNFWTVPVLAAFLFGIQREGQAFSRAR